mmetsp:Transcript_62332/g.115699  ORF Transcript_62332/g.115699 Transcript_62332/m.115699 type:complete len:124 (+) Transcript_62332:209-580(+)
MAMQRHTPDHRIGGKPAGVDQLGVICQPSRQSCCSADATYVLATRQCYILVWIASDDTVASRRSAKKVQLYPLLMCVCRFFVWHGMFSRFATVAIGVCQRKFMRVAQATCSPPGLPMNAADQP